MFYIISGLFLGNQNLLVLDSSGTLSAPHQTHEDPLMTWRLK